MKQGSLTAHPEVPSDTGSVYLLGNETFVDSVDSPVPVECERLVFSGLSTAVPVCVCVRVCVCVCVCVCREKTPNDKQAM